MSEVPATMNERECLDAITEGTPAYILLFDADPSFEREFNRVDKALVKLLARVRTRFPDAEYYTASGGFNLLLGSPHDQSSRSLKPQQELVALSGQASIGDGDF